MLFVVNIFISRIISNSFISVYVSNISSLTKPCFALLYSSFFLQFSLVKILQPRCWEVLWMIEVVFTFNSGRALITKETKTSFIIYIKNFFYFSFFFINFILQYFIDLIFFS